MRFLKILYSAQLLITLSPIAFTAYFLSSHFCRFLSFQLKKKFHFNFAQSFILLLNINMSFYSLISSINFVMVPSLNHRSNLFRHCYPLKFHSFLFLHHLSLQNPNIFKWISNHFIYHLFYQGIHRNLIFCIYPKKLLALRKGFSLNVIWFNFLQLLKCLPDELLTEIYIFKC